MRKSNWIIFQKKMRSKQTKNTLKPFTSYPIILGKKRLVNWNVSSVTLQTISLHESSQVWSALMDFSQNEAISISSIWNNHRLLLGAGFKTPKKAWTIPFGRIPYIYIYRLRARFRRARKPHFFQYVCAMTYYIQAHHATSVHNLPKPHVWQCVCVMQFSINFIMELAYATLQHCITHVSSTFFTLSPCYMKYRWIMLKGGGEGGGGGGQRVLRKSWMEGGGVAGNNWVYLTLVSLNKDNSSKL